jgi:8-oxo-dGTP pyrophosphatase MutT (NUDIX family)
MRFCITFTDEMSFGDFLHRLYAGLDKGLPGENAQRLMAPYGRKSLKELDFDAINPKLGATLLLLYPKENTVKSVLIKRPVYNGTHSAQVSFPGGKLDETDENLKQTALRETQEEVGCLSENIQIMTELTQVYIPPSNFLVSPFLGFCDSAPGFVANDREVDRIIEFNLSMILKEETIQKGRIQLSNNLVVETPYFNIENEVVWGATAVILAEFKALLEREDFKPEELYFPTF